MTDTNQEPTMEEILASIRRIISEDEAPQDGAPAAVEAAPAPAPAPPADEAVLDLTERVEEPAPYVAPVAETHGDLDVFAAPPSAPEPAPEPAPAPRAPEPVFQAAPREEETLVSPSTAGRAAAAFGSLADSLLMPAGGRTLEDVVRELLKPMLKEWLDENLPTIVQAKVEAEVERIARGRGR